MINYKVFKKTIKEDAFRYTGSYSSSSLLKLYFKTPGFKYTVKLRFANLCKNSKNFRILFPLAYWMYRRSMIKYGIGIPYSTQIGSGFYIGHFGGIVINSNVKIGANVNLSHGVTIGQGGDDGNKGCPVIGNGVYIGPNSTIIGNITIGDYSAIGANAFVNKSVEANTTVGGVPAKVISHKGSANYVHNTIKSNGKSCNI